MGSAPSIWKWGQLPPCPSPSIPLMVLGFNCTCLLSYPDQAPSLVIEITFTWYFSRMQHNWNECSVWGVSYWTTVKRRKCCGKCGPAFATLARLSAQPLSGTVLLHVNIKCLAIHRKTPATSAIQWDQGDSPYRVTGQWDDPYQDVGTNHNDNK